MKSIHRENRLFNYDLNDKKTKEKLLKGAKRASYQKEVKISCVNLVFNDGAFIHVVLPLMRNWENMKSHGEFKFEKA